jgi:putative ABC transport system substrate-binding protein
MVAWPLPLGAQQAMPVIGFFRSTPSSPFTHLLNAFRLGLAETGFVEGQNVLIEQRWADNQPHRLSALAADLVSRQVRVIVGNGPAMEAAKVATPTIPIVFVVGDDPILVSSLSRPTGNVTGVSFFGGGELNAKRLEILHELAPKASVIAVLLDRDYAALVSGLPDLKMAIRTLGKRALIVEIGSDRELNEAFSTIAQSGGVLLVSGGPLFTSNRRTLVALAAQHSITAIYDLREFVEAGGLISYSASISAAYRQAGAYVGRILKGTHPSELPVMQPTQFELVIDTRTAKALGLAIPRTLLARADEVIE